jgi:hypothetical protein
MAQAKSIIFDIAAGKYEGDEINWKYCDTATDVADALEKFNSTRGYPVVEFTIHTTWDDGTTTRVPVFGGQLERLIDGQWVAIDEGGLTVAERDAYVKESRTF